MRSKRKGKEFSGAQKAVSRPNSFPLPFPTQTCVFVKRKLEEIPACGLPGFEARLLRYRCSALTN